jgi:NADH-quinone oxidoreductase subunit E
MNTTKIQLSAHVRKKIDHWLLKYPADQKRSAVLQALHFAQEENEGWLSEPVMDAVADYLGLAPISVYEVATFYSMFNLTKTGRYVIDVCTNISCALAGVDKIVDYLKQRLNVEIGQTTADGKFTLREVECLAACAAAPMFQIGKKYYENLTPDKIDLILAELE